MDQERERQRIEYVGDDSAYEEDDSVQGSDDVDYDATCDDDDDGWPLSPEENPN